MKSLLALSALLFLQQGKVIYTVNGGYICDAPNGGSCLTPTPPQIEKGVHAARQAASRAQTPQRKSTPTDWPVVISTQLIPHPVQAKGDEPLVSWGHALGVANTSDAQPVTATYKLGGMTLVSVNSEGVVTVNSDSGHVDRLSDAEYASLQKLRQAVVDEETKIAKAHGVRVVSQYDCLRMQRGATDAEKIELNIDPSATKDCDIAVLPEAHDIYEYRGHFLLINVADTPKGTQK